ncbi:hypothetical protein QN277_005899 [Acacia crassicarpa]|uniref:TIR domain-containing protein n=1 Tax=Acacia crassicarpa TaxID=499986 RepID=A0AAE1MEQ7_9FABA|nr:hypothetical protein QN277_005899 [Acacia crassicarpa]
MIIPNQEPSSSGSSSIKSIPNHYDVFLNFITETTFTTTLCDSLREKGIDKIFVDPKKKERKQVLASPDPLTVIKESKVSILVFSEDYASSADCLDELVEIMESQKKTTTQVVFPIFYQIEPTIVRHQKSKYGEAMEAHQRRFGDERVQKWKLALKEAADLSGWHSKPGSENNVVEEIVEATFSKLPPKRLHVGEHIVGLGPRIKDVTSLLDTVPILVIHGTAGVGKTTLAKAAYNSIVHRFQEAFFLSNIKEGMVRLQKARVLLLLDDMDKMEELEQLKGGREWFGKGSKVIVTTRNKPSLIYGHIHKYEMEGLNDNDSLELFYRYAFPSDKPTVEYEEMSKRMVSYAQGLPFVLKTMGSKLKYKSVAAWKCALDELERLPEKKVEGVLKIMGS